MLDSFTAATLVQAASKGNVDEVVDMGKKLQSDVGGGPTSEARDFFAQHQNKKCKVTGTTHEGIIYRLNEATVGFYPGSRYPIKIKITNGQSAGTIFEYGLDQIEVIEG